MRCFYHQATEAIAVCKNCGRGLCPACAVDVGNGLACRDRCEAEVQGLNEVIRRNKTSYLKTRGAYVRTAVFYAVVAVTCLIGGITDWRGFSWLLLPASLLFALAAYLHYSTGLKFEQE